MKEQAYLIQTPEGAKGALMAHGYIDDLVNRVAQATARELAEALAESLINKVSAMIAEPAAVKHERNKLAELMRANGHSYGQIAARFNLSRTQAYKLTKHVNNQ